MSVDIKADDGTVAEDSPLKKFSEVREMACSTSSCPARHLELTFPLDVQRSWGDNRDTFLDL